VRTLRVELVSEHASPLAVIGRADAGGQNVHVAALAAYLAGLGCDVTVSTRADAADLPPRVRMAPGVQVDHIVAGPREPIPKDQLWAHMPAFARALRRRWAVSPPDVVHAHFWMSGWAVLDARRELPDPPPLVQTFHALGVVKRRHQGEADTSPAARAGVEARLLRDADHVVATCTDEVAELAALGGDPDRVAVVPCGIEPATFAPHGPVAPPRRGRHRIVVLSRLVPRKGIDDVIAALPALPGTELLVAGGPPVAALDADPEARRLRGLARRHGVADRVVLLGAVARPDVPPLLRSADVVACVPWYEPFGIVPLEAMACGVPVVGSAVGGLLDTVDHGATGLLVPPRDPAAVAAAVGRLLDDPARRAAMGAEAAARARREFTWDQVARSTLAVYERLRARRAVPAPDPSWAVTA
jgi:glycosyltransferase involved in cell wall biosynthesis